MPARVSRASATAMSLRLRKTFMEQSFVVGRSSSANSCEGRHQLTLLSRMDKEGRRVMLGEFTQHRQCVHAYFVESRASSPARVPRTTERGDFNPPWWAPGCAPEFPTP